MKLSTGMRPATKNLIRGFWGGNMRKVTLFCTILLLSALGFGQTVVRGFAGYCPYGCGPYVPMITTPMLSFGTVSPNPAGATNATGGLIAGATNSTLSEVSGNLNAVYTMPVWYSGGGTPLIDPAVNTPLESRRMALAEYGHRMHREHEPAREAWTYFSRAEQTASPVLAARAAQGPKPTVRTFTNADVQRQNQQNGLVKYDGKTEKIQ
jgi:hypothetical protein